MALCLETVRILLELSECICGVTPEDKVTLSGVASSLSKRARSATTMTTNRQRVVVTHCQQSLLRPARRARRTRTHLLGLFTLVSPDATSVCNSFLLQGLNCLKMIELSRLSWSADLFEIASQSNKTCCLAHACND